MVPAQPHSGSPGWPPATTIFRRLVAVDWASAAAAEATRLRREIDMELILLCHRGFGPHAALHHKVGVSSINARENGSVHNQGFSRRKLLALSAGLPVMAAGQAAKPVDGYVDLLRPPD